MLSVGFATFCVLVGLTHAREIPDYIKICKRSDPDVAKCIIASIESIRPQLKAGLPDIAVPALEPLEIERIEESGHNFKVILTNVFITGLGNFQITNLDVDVDNNVYNIGLKFPELVLKSDLDIDAKVLLLAIKGQGKCTVVVSEVTGDAVLTGEIVEKDGMKVLKFKSLDLNFKIKDFAAKLDDLFGGDEALSQAVRDLLANNKQDLADMVIPVVQKKAAEMVLESGNKITDSLDYDKAFPN